jgi:hypothetical protein
MGAGPRVWLQIVALTAERAQMEEPDRAVIAAGILRAEDRFGRWLSRFAARNCETRSGAVRKSARRTAAGSVSILNSRRRVPRIQFAARPPRRAKSAGLPEAQAYRLTFRDRPLSGAKRAVPPVRSRYSWRGLGFEAVRGALGAWAFRAG